MSDLDLARRAVACEGWRWRPRMASVWQQRPEHGGNRIVHTVEGPDRLFSDPWFNPERGRWELVGPDLSDPATLGCLLALVREVWPLRPAHAAPHETYSPEYGEQRVWTVRFFDGVEWRQVSGPTEAAALIAALEAADGR